MTDEILNYLIFALVNLLCTLVILYPSVRNIAKIRDKQEMQGILLDAMELILVTQTKTPEIKSSVAKKVKLNNKKSL